MRYFKTGLYSSCLMLSFSLFSSATSLYTLDSVSPTGTMTFSLQLPKSETDSYLQVRGENWGLINQVENPRCNGKPLSQDKLGRWIAPSNCTVVHWNVQPKQIPSGDVDTSLQETILIPNDKESTILLSEPTSLLRIENDKQSIIKANKSIKLLGATSINKNELSTNNPSWLVPSYNNAPEFYLIGDIDTDKATAENINVTYYSDNADLTNHLQLREQHSKILSFLIRSISPNESSHLFNNSDLLVVWIGNNEKNNFIGGAAGNRSFIANYIYGDSPNVQEHNIKTRLVTAHEQFHQLVDIIRGENASQPVWVEEGLAQYYGLKALNHVKESDDKLVTKVFTHFIDPKAPVAATFIELEEKFQQGDRTIYPLFYSQGATFWYQLDNTLLQETNGKYGLDHLVTLLIKTQPNDNGGLPEAFISEAVKLGGEPAQQLIQKYVGN